MFWKILYDLIISIEMIFQCCCLDAVEYMMVLPLGIGIQKPDSLEKIFNSKKSYLDVPEINSRVKLIKLNGEFLIETKTNKYPIPKELKDIKKIINWLRDKIIYNGISGVYSINDNLSPGEKSARLRAIEKILETDKIDRKIQETLAGNPQRYIQAVSMFSVLNKYRVTPVLVMAVIRNEIENYDASDERQDISAKQGQAKNSTTLGYGQISSKGVQGLRSEFPQLDKLLSEQGFPNDQAGNQRALVSPRMVPYLVSAKLASIASIYEKSPQENIKITPQTIVYGYNADVFALNPKSKDDLKVGFQWKLIPGIKKVFPGNGNNQFLEFAAQVSTYVQGVQKNTMALIHGGIFNSSFESK